MLKRNYVFVVMAVFALAVAFLIAAFAMKEKSPQETGSEVQNNSQIQTTNSELIQSENDTPISTENDLAYFTNAKGFYVEPAGEGPYPGVVLIHENRGLRPEIKQAAEELAKYGYKVLAVDLYRGNVLDTQDQAKEFSGSFDQKEGTENLKAAVKYLRDKGATSIASLGWCFGGRQSLELATSGEKLDATIVYYGGGMKSTQDELKAISWPVLGIFGDKDTAIPLDKVKEFESSLNALNIENEIYIYPNVGHAFANPSGANYAPNETVDAWGKTVAFLEKHLH